MNWALVVVAGPVVESGVRRHGLLTEGTSMSTTRPTPPVPDNRTEALPHEHAHGSANRNPAELVIDEIRSTLLAWLLCEAGKLPIDHAADAKHLWCLFDKRIGAPPDIGEVKDEQQARRALRLMEAELTTLLSGADPTPSEPATTGPLTEANGSTGGGAGAKRLTKEESNTLVSDYLTKHKARAAKGEVSIREISQEIGVPISSIANTSAWHALQGTLEAKGLSKRTRRRKAQAYTAEMDSVVGQDETDDAELQELIKEQESDYEPAPIDKGHRPKVRVKKKF
jgi:hypothetical protein